MKFTTNKILWTDAMKDFAEATITKKLERLVFDYSDATVALAKLNDNIIKVSLSLDKFRAQAVGADFYAILTEAATTLKNIITKHKAKYNNHSKHIVTTEIDNFEPDQLQITKEKLFTLVPCAIDEAIKEFEQTDYSFFVFKDSEDNDNFKVIYKRFDNTYGLIRCI